MDLITIEKLKKFIIDSVDPSQVDKLGKEDPVDILIRVVYGKIRCEELERVVGRLGERLIPCYVIITIHRALFEQQGKCVRQLLDIAENLNPHTANYSILLKFYQRVYEVIEGGKVRDKKELYNIYNEFKDYFEFKALASQKVIKVVLAYLGVKEVGDINFEDESYVHYYSFEFPLEEAVEKLGLVYIEDERTLLRYYEKWFHKVRKDRLRRIRRFLSLFSCYYDHKLEEKDLYTRNA